MSRDDQEIQIGVAVEPLEASLATTRVPHHEDTFELCRRCCDVVLGNDRWLFADRRLSGETLFDCMG
jgi:hypothetical protein